MQLFIIGMFGASLASFIQCMVDRYIHKTGVWGRSRCDHCHHVLSATDLIPIFGFLLRQGKCRYCKRRISKMYFLSEILFFLLFIIIRIRFSETFLMIRYMGFSVILFGVFLTDLKTYVIPDVFHSIGILWYFLTVPQWSNETGSLLLYAIASGFTIAGSLLLIEVIFHKATGKEGLGGGDIKLFFVIGMYIGIVKSYYCLLLACILGIISMRIMHIEKIPFGPCIVTACMTVILYFG